ncbi:trehalose 6-phosphate synthase [Halomicrobium zhouii]|uniref:Trehalose 6-phosphate synthase n=1 Tax=Halomicrobium zhouii TaxID=767519 RepID=A0A1I6M1W1_9EURY|nr:trehalose-6-phosphate synthase [Halomicrobium zhouii]SFS09653.1 trehalose 6-phosphate synthase [Halomicrobium zhouii]
MEKSHLSEGSVDRGSTRPTPGVPGEELLVLSNRQPYRHSDDDGDGITVDAPAGGLTAGLDAVMRQVNGTWIAWGDGDADAAVVDDDGRVTVPPGESDGQYTLERLWLTDEQVDNYYYGFSNRVLWPICHSALTNVDGNARFWDHYQGVNERFADAVVDSADPRSVVWFHDYHLGLAAEMVQDRIPEGVFCIHTWHIPWPSWDVFRACPHGREVLRGMLGNDLVGFHVPRYCDNFLRCVSAALPGAHVDWENRRVVHEQSVTTVRAFPMGVPADDINRQAKHPGAETFWRDFSDTHGIDDDTKVGVGVDRLDYTKGIPQRIEALERLWESSSQWRESFTYVQVGTESRSQIDAYSQYQQRVEDAVESVNERFGTDDWQPIVYTTDYLADEALYALYRFADVAIVSPIRDGMNLVCQEYVAAQQDDDGVLVLSDQAGAHDELHEWVMSINPHDTTAFKETVDEALAMPREERRPRMDALRRHVATNDISTWIRTIFATVDALREPTPKDQHHASV